MKQQSVLMEFFKNALLKSLAAISIGVMAATSNAVAAEPVFPPGLRVGIVPMAGLVAASEFAGFESPDKKLKVGLVEIPEAAFAAFDSAFKDGKGVGLGPKPEAIETRAGKSYLAIESGKENDVSIRSFSLIVPARTYSGYVVAQIREDADQNYTADAIRSMLASTVTRENVPVEEQLGQLPFKVSELSGFKTIRTLGQQASVLLTDGEGTDALENAPYMVIGIMQGTAETSDARARFAQQAAATIPGLREGRITSNEPLRIDGTPGFETRIDAVSGKSDTPVSVVQWLRFGGGASTLRIIASSKREEWPGAFPRFRAVRDGIGPK